MPLTDEQLADAFVRYHAALLGFVAKRTQDDDVAEEIVGQVWLLVVRSRHTYEERGHPVGAWLYRIAHARCVDYHRAQQRAQSTAEAVVTSGFEDRVIARLDTPVVRLLTSLPPRYQDVLWRRFVLDHPLSEVAQEFGLTLGGAKALQHRALTMARERLTVKETL